MKLGSITADGKADVFCYMDDEEIVDPELASHLVNWGIKLADVVVTEKSLAEMQLDLQYKYSFNMSSADGVPLQAVFGPGLTGFVNLGNSCYVSSVIQVFHTTLLSPCLLCLSLLRLCWIYGDSLTSRHCSASRNGKRDILLPLKCIPTNAPSPTKALERDHAWNVKWQRFAMALCPVVIPSNKVTPPNPRHFPPFPSSLSYLLTFQVTVHPDGTTEEYQNGISPRMFKSLIGQGHAEFAGTKQQDAQEFLIWLISRVQRMGKPTGAVAERLTLEESAHITKAVEQGGDTRMGDEGDIGLGWGGVVDPTFIFRFVVQTRIQCLGCSGVKYGVQQVDNINIAVPDRLKA